MSTRKRSDADFEREIHAHIDLETDRLVADGLTPDSARDVARRSFGNVTLARERFHERGRLLWFDRLVQDTRCAVRNMRRAPVASIVAIASLAAGIGATTVTLTVGDVVFYKPPPLYQSPEQLSKIQIGRPARQIMPAGSHVPAGLYAAWSERFATSIGASQAMGTRDVRAGGRLEIAPVRAVTPGFFNLVGVRAELGHLGPASPESGVDVSAVLSYGLWERLYDKRADVVGTVLWIDNVPHTVTAVLPQRFWFGDMNSPVWTALNVRALPPDEEVQVIIRRPDGINHSMLHAQLQPGLADYARELPAGQRELRLRGWQPSAERSARISSRRSACRCAPAAPSRTTIPVV